MSALMSTAAIAALAVLAFALPAAADVMHVVGRGHTIEAIAHRYHVSTKVIIEANHLKDPRHLKVGETLVIPGVQPKGSKPGAPGAKGGPTPTYAMRPKTPGVVHVTRLATNEDYVVRVQSRHGHAAPTSLATFEKMMRSSSGLTHPPDPRLIELIGTVSNHFGSRRLEIISGFRPYSPTQYTAHSNHNIGHAMDFRVVGVPNEVLRDYCRTLKDVGVGYYPNSTFVHLDVRSSPAFWIDFSRPGEPPRYNTPNADADEGTSDVSEEPHAPESNLAPESTFSPEAPLPAIPPAPPIVAQPPSPAPPPAMPSLPPASGSPETR
jgi:uncharacterized protein YcbK (DUF882 family)